jgi:hypothetical protein
MFGAGHNEPARRRCIGVSYIQGFFTVTPAYMIAATTSEIILRPHEIREEDLDVWARHRISIQGGRTMIWLKASLLVMVCLVAGCQWYKDIRVLKAFLGVQRVPDQCGAPGTFEHSKICLYKLEITQVIDPSTARAKVDFAEVLRVTTDCPQVQASVVEQYDNVKYDCVDVKKFPDFYPDKNTEYTFTVEGGTGGLTPGRKQAFNNVPNSRKLVKAP